MLRFGWKGRKGRGRFFGGLAREAFDIKLAEARSFGYGGDCKDLSIVEAHVVLVDPIIVLTGI